MAGRDYVLITVKDKKAESAGISFRTTRNFTLKASIYLQFAGAERGSLGLCEARVIASDRQTRFF